MNYLRFVVSKIKIQCESYLNMHILSCYLIVVVCLFYCINSWMNEKQMYEKLKKLFTFISSNLQTLSAFDTYKTFIYLNI